ncbi:MAG: transglycosylase domain-containing protein [Hyphomonadaceae bacterium]
MRAVFIFVVILLLIGMAVPVTFAVRFWMDGSAVVARAEQAGALRVSARGPLTPVERTIAMSEFRGTWKTHGQPCRTLFFIWTDLTTEDAPRGMPVSQRVSTALLGEQNGTSIRWQIRRIVAACHLERRFDDPRLLRVWLASAYFGRNETGIETASQSIFGKPSSELNAEESARLAVLLRAPGLRSNPELWAERARELQGRIAAR